MTCRLDPRVGVRRNSSHHQFSEARTGHVRAVATGRIEDRLGNVGAALLAQIREVLGLILDIPG